MNVFFLEIEECNMISPAGNGNGKQFGVENVCLFKEKYTNPRQAGAKKKPAAFNSGFFGKCDIGDAKGGK